VSHSYSIASFGLGLVFVAGSCSLAIGQDAYVEPAGYYSGATGTGNTLKSQLTSAMSAGHIQRSYGDFRNSASIHDRDPNNPSRIILVYNLASVPAQWDSGNTWNREHVWPQSRQPGSASNSTRGNLGDPHALRPANPSINSSRGNKPFGNASTTGNFGSLGTFYFPGDTDKGDIARSLFYSATRYSSTGLTLVNGVPSGNRMGDLASLVAWHYLDVPGEFERRRNHAIYSAALNPAFRTNNRNAYVDHPEFVWSVFVDQMNDSTLWFGDLEPADGASAIDVDLGNVLVGDAIDPMGFVLNKSGAAGTYYRVSASAGVSTDAGTVYDAFAMSGTNLSRTITVSVDASATDVAGAFDADIRVDNLDVTTQGGAGNGGNDVDDMIFVSFDVFEGGNGSFEAGSDVDVLNLDLGTISIGDGDFVQSFSFFHIGTGGAFGAPVDVELISSVGDTGALTTNFVETNSISAGGSASFDAVLDDQNGGAFSATYTFRVWNDRGMFVGVSSIEEMTLVLSGAVSGGECNADLNGDGDLNFFDVSAFLSLFSAGDLGVDFNGDGDLNFFDVSAFLSAYGAGCP